MMVDSGLLFGPPCSLECRQSVVHALMFLRLMKLISSDSQVLSKLRKGLK